MQREVTAGERSYSWTVLITEAFSRVIKHKALAVQTCPICANADLQRFTTNRGEEQVNSVPSNLFLFLFFLSDFQLQFEILTGRIARATGQWDRLL